MHAYSSPPNASPPHAKRRPEASRGIRTRRRTRSVRRRPPKRGLFDGFDEVEGSGEGGIRTRGRLLSDARLASEYLRPLGHLSHEGRSRNLPRRPFLGKTGGGRG